MDDFTALYNDHPGGKGGDRYWIAVGKRWWAGDSLLKAQPFTGGIKISDGEKLQHVRKTRVALLTTHLLTTSRSRLNIALSRFRRMERR